MSTLFLVATPIGNLEDITARAVRVLGEVELIAAEDTRQTAKLLNHLNIRKRLTSYYEHNKLDKLGEILEALNGGDVALVSDAGTPALNDPGYELVRAVLEAGHQVSPVPGPSAPIAALVASGLPTDRFLYLGYLPRKSSDRRRQLQEVRVIPYTLICLEAPHRLLGTLHDMLSEFGDRQVAVARELTKHFEEIFRGTLSAAEAHFQATSPRGEITLVVAGASPQASQWTLEHLLGVLKDSLAQGQSPAKIAKQVSKESGWSRRQVYDLILEQQEQRAP
jgi:16S rRNA (cytidine1402-2'-O)-methyltransferase